MYTMLYDWTYIYLSIYARYTILIQLYSNQQQC